MADSTKTEHRHHGSWLKKIFKKSKKKSILAELEQVKTDQLYMENALQRCQRDLVRMGEENELLRESLESLQQKLTEVGDLIKDHVPPACRKDEPTHSEEGGQQQKLDKAGRNLGKMRAWARLMRNHSPNCPQYKQAQREIEADIYRRLGSSQKPGDCDTESGKDTLVNEDDGMVKISRQVNTPEVIEATTFPEEGKTEKKKEDEKEFVCAEKVKEYLGDFVHPEKQSAEDQTQENSHNIQHKFNTVPRGRHSATVSDGEWTPQHTTRNKRGNETSFSEQILPYERRRKYTTTTTPPPPPTPPPQNEIEDIRQHNISNVLSGGNTSDFINYY